MLCFHNNERIKYDKYLLSSAWLSRNYGYGNYRYLSFINNLLNAKIYYAENFQIGHVASRHDVAGSKDNACAHPYHVTRSINYPRNSLLVLQLRSQELPREGT